MKQLLRSGGVLVLSRVLGAALTVALSVSVGRGLGQVGFGQWTLTLAWASALAMLSDFNLNLLLTREAARARAQSNQFLLGSLVGKLPLLILLGGLVSLSAPWLGEGLAVTQSLQVVVLLAGASLAYGSFTALFRALDRMTWILWLDTGGLLAQLLGSVWMLRLGGGSHELVLVLGVVQTLQVIVASLGWWVWLRPAGGPVSVSLVQVKQMLVRAAPLAAALVLGALQLRASPLLVGYLRGAAEVGLFGAAWRFSEAAKLIPTGLFNAAFPAFAASLGQAQSAEVWRSFNRLLWGVGLVGTLALALGAGPLIELAYGAEFLPAANALLWLALGLIPSLLISGFEVYLYAVGDERYVVLWDAVGTLVLLVASVPLIVAYGASGAALGILLSKLALWFPLWRRIEYVRARAALGLESMREAG